MLLAYLGSEFDEEHTIRAVRGYGDDEGVTTSSLHWNLSLATA